MYNVLHKEMGFKMGIGIATIVVIILAILLLKSIISFSLKLIGIAILVAIAVFTIWICSEQPDMHKPFSLNTIEYLFNINKDGSLTTTKKVTQTVIKEQNGK